MIPEKLIKLIDEIEYNINEIWGFIRDFSTLPHPLLVRDLSCQYDSLRNYMETHKYENTDKLDLYCLEKIGYKIYRLPVFHNTNLNNPTMLDSKFYTEKKSKLSNEINKIESNSNSNYEDMYYLEKLYRELKNIHYESLFDLEVIICNFFELLGLDRNRKNKFAIRQKPQSVLKVDDKLTMYVIWKRLRYASTPYILNDFIEFYKILTGHFLTMRISWRGTKTELRSLICFLYQRNRLPVKWLELEELFVMNSTPVLNLKSASKKNNQLAHIFINLNISPDK